MTGATVSVGDVLDADSPEPPRGTVVVDVDGDAWQHRTVWWQAAPNEDSGARWRDIVGVYSPVTVVYVPGA